MRKISRVVVREMTTLTNEEMALITGGDVSGASTTKYVLCSAATAGQVCRRYDSSKGEYVGGICHHDYVHNDFETISYSYCA